jgi:riboflavin synthase
MFTGLVADKGSIRSVDRNGEDAVLVLESDLSTQLAVGDSVCVSGVCLTATSVDDQSFTVEVVPETLSRCTLAGAGEGDEVNLELALRPDSRLAGHIVQGHVDGTAEVLELETAEPALVVRFGCRKPLLRYVAEKGSIAIEGVSLTIVAVDEDSFAVSLIPETLKRTTLGKLAKGQLVNIEVDVIAKYVERLVEPE